MRVPANVVGRRLLSKDPITQSMSVYGTVPEFIKSRDCLRMVEEWLVAATKDSLELSHGAQTCCVNTPTISKFTQCI